MKLLKTVLGAGLGLGIGLGLYFCEDRSGERVVSEPASAATSAAPPSPPKKGRVVEQPIQPVVVKKVALIKAATPAVKPLVVKKPIKPIKPLKPAKRIIAKSPGPLLVKPDDSNHKTQFSLSGVYGQNNGSYGSLDVLHPLYQRSDRLVFLDLRGVIKKSPVKEFNVGGGYRWLSSDKQKLYGAYGFYDRKMSENNNWFTQLTIGGELKTKRFSLGGNVYLPVGTKSHEVARRLHAQARPYRGDTFVIDYGDMVDTEYALSGVDAEVGYAIPKVTGLKGYLGGYYFSHSKVDKVMGPRATLVYDLSSLMPTKLALIDHLELETSIQHDKPRGSTWYAGFRLQMQLGSSNDKPKLSGLEKQLTAFVRRDLDVVDQQGTAFDSQVWTKETGDPYVGKIVTTAVELAAITGGEGIDKGAVDIIGVRGTIEVEGNAIADNATAAQIKATRPAIRLNYGQSITGQGLTFTVDGKEYTAKIVNSDQGIAGADPNLVGDAGRGGITLLGANGKVGHLLQVYTDATATTVDRDRLEVRVQRIEDLILRVPENGQDYQGAVGNASGIQSSVISNATGRMTVTAGVDERGNKHSFGHVVIDHINANSNVYLATDADKTGKLRLTASQFTAIEFNTFGAIANIESVAKEDLIIESIDHNHLVRLTGAGNSVNGLSADYLNGPVTNNYFGPITGPGDVNGSSSGILAVLGLSSSVSGNTFEHISTVLGSATGVEVGLGDLSGHVINNHFGLITTPHTNQVGQNKGAWGVIAGEALSGSVSGNTFDAIIATSNGKADGVYVRDSLSGSVTDNVFNHITSNGSNPIGIYQGNPNMTINIADINGNRFNVTAVAGFTAYGLRYNTGSTPVITNAIRSQFTAANTFGGNIAGGNEISQGD